MRHSGWASLRKQVALPTPLKVMPVNWLLIGSHVRLSKERLRNEYLPRGISSYVRVSVNGKLAGNAFACRWSVESRTVCWITQLVVHRDYRERGLATGLLNEVKLNGDDVYGIMSSHPAACLAAAKAFGS
jgi:GNAT superfamily N-acetyltransferase